MSLEALKSDWIKYAYKKDSREFIYLLAYIGADKTLFSSSLINKGDLKSL